MINARHINKTRYNITNIKLKLVLCCLMCISFSKVYSQRDSLRIIYTDVKQTDSVRFMALDTLFFKYYYKEPDSTLKAINYHKQLAEENNNKEEICKSLIRAALIYGPKREYEKCLRLFNDALVIAKELNKRNLEAIIISRKALLFQETYKYLEAVQSGNEALVIFRELKMNSEAAWVLQNLGNINLYLGNYDLALEYFQQYQTAHDTYNFPNDQSFAYNQELIGRVYLEKELYEDALIYFENAFKHFTSLEIKYKMKDSSKFLAIIHTKLNQLDKATNYAQKNLALSKELKSEMDVDMAEFILAEITFKTDIPSALKQAKAILNRLPNERFYSIKKDIYNLLYKGYKSQNNSKLAVEMLERSTVYKDSINLEIDRLAVTRELVKQDYEHRISESKLKSENEKAALKITQLKRTFAVVIISALFIFCVIFYFRSKTKKDKAIRAAMLDEIMRLKNSSNQVVAATTVFELVREKIEHSIKRKLNETDWKVLNVLLVEPVMTNKEIAQKVFLSADGVGSSLRRMYEYFNIKESKYKKVSLLLETIKRSNS